LVHHGAVGRATATPSGALDSLRRSRYSPVPLSHRPLPAGSPRGVRGLTRDRPCRARSSSLRLETVGVDCDLHEALALSNLRDGDPTRRGCSSRQPCPYNRKLARRCPAPVPAPDSMSRSRGRTAGHAVPPGPTRLRSRLLRHRCPTTPHPAVARFSSYRLPPGRTMTSAQRQPPALPPPDHRAGHRPGPVWRSSRSAARGGTGRAVSPRGDKGRHGAALGERLLGTEQEDSGLLLIGRVAVQNQPA